MTMRRAAVVLVLLGLALGACAGGDDDSDEDATPATEPTTTTTAPPTPEEHMADIKAMWTRFFSPGESLENKVPKLENGETHRAAIVQTIETGQVDGVTVGVKKVVLADETTADITFDIFLNGDPVVPNATGQAKFVDDEWKVSEKTFCVLISIGNIHPASCEPVMAA